MKLNEGMLWRIRNGYQQNIKLLNMEKKLTPMGELIADLNRLYWLGYQSMTIPDILKKAESLLPKEREAIEGAYIAGNRQEFYDGTETTDYFTQTYQQ